MTTDSSSDYRALITQLCTLEADALESETLEIKSWCKSARDLGEEVSEAALCLANKGGGLVLVGVEDRSPGRFSHCPHSDVSPEWLVRRVHDLTVPPVDCVPLDLSDELREVHGRPGYNLYAVRVSRTRQISGHQTVKGLSKVRVGKECRPQYIAEDDRSAARVPGSCITDLSPTSIDSAIAEHTKHFNAPRAQWADTTQFLAHARLIAEDTCNDAPDQPRTIPLAALLLFASESALLRLMPHVETVIVAPLGEIRLRRNIVDSLRMLLGSDPPEPRYRPALASAKDVLAKQSQEMLRELLVNAYIHRCYRSNGPVEIRVSTSQIEVRNPGGLPPGMSPSALIYCTPVYRNFLLADAARFIGLCDKIGKGMDIIFRAVLSGGFDFPMFESNSDTFAATIPLEHSEKFSEFARRRAQSLASLDKLAVLRLLWARESATIAEISSATQRGNGPAREVIRRLLKEGVIAAADGFGKSFALAAVVRRDIDGIFQSDQFDLFGEPERNPAIR